MKSPAFSVVLALIMTSCAGSSGEVPDAALDGDAGSIDSRGADPPIALTVDLHMDPISQIPLDNRREMYRSRRDNAIWLLDTSSRRATH